MKCFEHPTVCVIAILKVKQENNGGRRVDVKGGGGGGGEGNPLTSNGSYDAPLLIPLYFNDAR